VNFVADKDHMGASGMVHIETLGLNYVIPVTGAAYNAGLITPLPLSPVVAGSHGTAPGGTDNATLGLNQASATTYTATSNVPDSGDFTFSGPSWGYFKDSNNDGIPDSPAVFIGTGASLGRV